MKITRNNSKLKKGDIIYIIHPLNDVDLIAQQVQMKLTDGSTKTSKKFGIVNLTVKNVEVLFPNQVMCTADHNSDITITIEDGDEYFRDRALVYAEILKREMNDHDTDQDDYEATLKEAMNEIRKQVVDLEKELKETFSGLNLRKMFDEIMPK